MSTAAANQPNAFQRAVASLTDPLTARKAAAIVLFVFVSLAMAILFRAHIQNGNRDETTGEANYQFLFEIGLPSAIYIAATFPICSKKRRTPKYNMLAPVSLVALIIGCIWILYWVVVFSNGYEVMETIAFQDDPTHSQQHTKTLELAHGINALCQYGAIYITSLLGLDVWAATAK